MIELVSVPYTVSLEVIAVAEGAENRNASWAVDFVLDGN